jgi:hypothetical protein
LAYQGDDQLTDTDDLLEKVKALVDIAVQCEKLGMSCFWRISLPGLSLDCFYWINTLKTMPAAAVCAGISMANGPLFIVKQFFECQTMDICEKFFPYLEENLDTYTEVRALSYPHTIGPRC